MKRHIKTVLPALWVTFLLLVLPVASQAGCGLAFLNGTTPTIDGSLTTTAGEWSDASVVRSVDPCLELLPDALPGAGGVDDVTTDPPGTHEVVFHTKRDNTHLYIGIDVDDATGGGAIVLGERIIVHMDPDNSRDPHPSAADFRLDFTYMRGSAGDDIIEWSSGTGAGWGNTVPLPAGVQIGRQNRPAGPGIAPGYRVEIKIPFAAIGYTLPADPNLITDMGMAIGVINDLALSAGSGAWYVAGVAFPETAALHLNNANDVMDSTAVHADWNNPSNWGEAFLTGAGQQIYISRSPKSWLSEDIKAGFCNAADFEDTGERSTDNPKWYKYKSANPCPLRLWGKVRRQGALVGLEERKVLFLWAEHGANPQKWYYVDLVDIDLPAGSDFEITRRIDWNSVPAGKENHPCLRAFILPKDLNHATVDQGFLQNIGTEAGNNASKISQIRSAYGLATDHEAQMNIHMLADFSCPECASGRNDSKKRWLASFRFVGESHAQATTTAGSPGNVVIHDPEVKIHDFVADIQLNGVAASPGTKKYQYVEVLGGVQEVINLQHMRKNKEVRIPFNIANSEDMERRLYLNATALFPEEFTKVELAIEQPKGVFKKGETRKVVSRFVAGTAQPPKPEKCFPIGGGASVTLLGMGVIGVGVAGARRRKRSGTCAGDNQ